MRNRKSQKTLNFRGSAQTDVIGQQDWYIEQRAYDVAKRFGQSVADLMDQLLVTPIIGRLENEYRSLPGLRSCAIDGFEAFRMYYIDRENLLDIVRVLHSSRDVGAILDADHNI